MCGRYSLSRTGRLVLTNRFGLIEEFDEQRLPPIFNLAPTEPAPVIIQEDDKRRLQSMMFGLIPHWAKDPRIGVQCINARAETVDKKPAFREPLRKRRCLVISDGYFEWKHEGKTKAPYRVVMKSGDVFAFAGLWDAWKRPDGTEIKTFAIITTESNGLTREFHERMPAILTRENEPLWLSPAVSEPRTLLPLLKPYPIEEMTMYPVSPLINKATNKGPEAIQPLFGSRN